MTSNENAPNVSPPPPGRRRSSFAELFASRPNLDSGNTKPQSSAMSAAISQQAQEQSRSRRLSITTLGLSGSPTHGQQTSPFGALRQGRRTSNGDGSNGSSEGNESAVDESDSLPPLGESDRRTSGPSSPPLGRRLSLGAKAYRDARSASISGAPNGSGGAGATGNGSASTSPPAVRGKEGFNWTENFRNRAERASISAASAPGGMGSMMGGHNRSKSQVMADPSPKSPVAPKPVQKAPDHFQERILKGDFYMD